MSILNLTNDGLISVLVTLWRGIVTLGKMPEAKFIKLVTPETLLGGDSKEMVKQTLSTWKTLGVFGEDKGKLFLHRDLKDIHPDDINKFRLALVKFVMLKANNMWVEDEEKHMDNCSDFTRALCWLLMQDPYGFPGNYEDIEKLHNVQRVIPPVFINRTRWNGLKSWSDFFGFGQNVGYDGHLIPNPALVIESLLSEIFDQSSELPQDEFFKKLIKMLPVLDGGTYRKSFAKQVGTPWREEKSHEVSPSLSLALQSLSIDDLIRFESKSDAPGKNRILVGKRGKPIMPFSHIVRLV